MRIYIVGPIASGKTTLAKRLSNKLSIPWFELDEIQFLPSSTTKRNEKEKTQLFNSIINSESWIIEDTGRPCFREGLSKADYIVLLKYKKTLVFYRLMVRIIKQRLGINKSPYPINKEIIYKMISWINNFYSGRDKLIDTLKEYDKKTIVISSTSDCTRFFNYIVDEGNNS